ncbi:MAG TPA: hypothetical protein VFU14_20250 [Acidimicrobiales bacterium]|nr:hypothetical protein [Acidimicrobiales bacterium]
MTDDAGDEPFTTALAELLRVHGMSYRGLAAALAEDGQLERPPSKDTVALWVRGKQPMWPHEVFAVERVLDERPGTLSRHLGYVPADAAPATKAEDAVAEDVELRDSAESILAVIAVARRQAQQRRRR